MAKLKGPLLSMDARGQIGKAVVFSGWKGLSTARAHVVPTDARSPAQLARRSAMTFCRSKIQIYGLWPVDWAALDLVASLESRPMSGYNYAMKKGLEIPYQPGGRHMVRKFEITLNSGGNLNWKIQTNMTDGGRFYATYNIHELGPVHFFTAPAVNLYVYAQMTGLTPGRTLFIKVRNIQEPTTCVSGIYRVHLAA